MQCHIATWRPRPQPQPLTLHCRNVITVINRSEVVGRPLAALLANDGARVISVDIDCKLRERIAWHTEVGQLNADSAAIVEFSKRPSTASSTTSFHKHHVVTPVTTTLEEALRVSDVVISAVPNDKYKIPTAWLKDGCVCVNVAGEKNFEADVRERVSGLLYWKVVGAMSHGRV